jgi:hypothetical protein
MIFFVRTHLANFFLDHFRSSVSPQRLPRNLTMDSIEVDKLLVDEVRLNHWDCTLVFDVSGLEGQHDIIQYVKPNALAKYLELMMECTTNGFPKQCMRRFPEVYSVEMMWDMLKSAICKASGYTLRSIQGNKSTVLTKKCQIWNSSF